MPSKTKKRKKLTAAQLAARRRSAAAKKAAETRRLNALKKATAKRRRSRAAPRKLTGIQQVARRAKERREKAKAPSFISQQLAKKKSTKSKTVGSAFSTGSSLLKGFAGKRALLATLKQEPKAVRNFAKRAIKKGQTPKKAIEQGRILNDAGRLGDNGKLKKLGSTEGATSNRRSFFANLLKRRGR